MPPFCFLFLACRRRQAEPFLHKTSRSLRPRLLICKTGICTSMSTLLSFPGGEIRGQLFPATTQMTFSTSLRGANEVPPNTSTGTGTGRVLLSDAQDKIIVNLTFSGLTGAAAAAQIHGPAAPGTNAAVIFPFAGVPAATSGTIPEQTFAITP